MRRRDGEGCSMRVLLFQEKKKRSTSKKGIKNERENSENKPRSRFTNG